MTDLSGLSFAGSEAGGQEIALRYSGRVFIGHIYEDSRIVA